MESQLLNDLKSQCGTHGREARPANLANETIWLYFQFRLTRFDVDEAKNTLTISAWLRHVRQLNFKNAICKIAFFAQSTKLIETFPGQFCAHLSMPRFKNLKHM